MALDSQAVAVAVEGINRIPDLSPLARRLCNELIGRTDRKRGTCFPSEARLALSLDCDERSIRRAKVELRERGFLTWINRGAHKTPLYQVMFSAIITLAREIKRRIRQACMPYAAASKNTPDRPEPTPAPMPTKSGRTFSSTVLSQLFNKRRLLEKGGGALPNSTSGITLEQAHKNAEKRFWDDMRKLPQQTFIALTAAMTEEQQQSAVEAERRKFGTGVSTFLNTLNTGELV